MNKDNTFKSAFNEWAAIRIEADALRLTNEIKRYQTPEVWYYTNRSFEAFLRAELPLVPGHDKKVQMAKKDDEIILNVVSTPAGPFHGAFPKTTKVSAVIAAIVAALGLDAGEDLKLMNGDEPLAPERPLVSYHFGDEAALILLATGSGV